MPYLLTILIFLLFPAAGFAGNESAAACVKTGEHTITNTCAENITVFWCAKNAKSIQARCKTGAGEPFYSQKRSLRAGQTITNKNLIPENGGIGYGACFAKHKVQINEGGHYDCL